MIKIGNLKRFCSDNSFFHKMIKRNLQRKNNLKLYSDVEIDVSAVVGNLHEFVPYCFCVSKMNEVDQQKHE